MRFTQTPDPLHSAAPAIIVLCICIIVAAAAGTLAAIGSMKRKAVSPRTKTAGRTHTRSEWQTRIIAVQKDHARGLLDDKQAYHRLSVLSRQKSWVRMLLNILWQS